MLSSPAVQLCFNLLIAYSISLLVGGVDGILIFPLGSLLRYPVADLHECGRLLRSCASSSDRRLSDTCLIGSVGVVFW